MKSRIALFAAIALACSLDATAEAAKEVYFFGVRMNRRDFIAADVFSSSGLTAEIDMGYEHGVLEGQRMQIFRRSETTFVKVADAVVRRVDRKKSFVKSTSLKTISRKDFAVFPATQLDLWNRQKKLDYTAARKLVLTKIRGRYDSRETETDREDLLVLRRSKSRKFDAWRREVARYRSTQRIVLDGSRIRRYWLNFGATGIPKVKIRISDLKLGQSLEEMQLEVLRQVGVGVFDNPIATAKVEATATLVDDPNADPDAAPTVVIDEPTVSPGVKLVEDIGDALFWLSRTRAEEKAEEELKKKLNSESL